MDGGHNIGFRASPRMLFLLGLVLAGQTALTLERFGGWSNATSDEPILAGRHPLHLYHSMLGAETFRQRYSTACYDPNFQAGYPKTPVFDGGCRPGELCLLIAGAGRPIAAYKLGLFTFCCMVPLAFAWAGRGVGLSAMGSCVAAAFGSIVWWSAPIQALLEAGDIDLLLAGVSAIVFVTWLSKYHWDASPTSWLPLASIAVVGWYAHPVIWIGLLPVVLLYYIAAAPKHGPAWHLGLAAVTLAGLAPNMWWLWDWGRFWWLRQPSVDEIAPFPTWGAVLGSTPENLGLLGHGLLGWPLVLSGLLACLVLFAMNKRSATVVLASAGFLAFASARLGETWLPLMNAGATRVVPFTATLAVLPLAGLLSTWARHAVIGKPIMVIACAAPLLLSLTTAGHSPLHWNLTPLLIGLNDDQKQLVAGLNRQTDDRARIWIEDCASGSRPGWNWTALLPRLAPRAYLGGLDPEARFEHFHCGMMNGSLNGRLLSDWSDTELQELARRYNVGWLATRSDEATERWLRLPNARKLASYRDGGEVTLIALDRQHTFLLAGEAKWEQADRRKVVLTDVVPADAPNPDGGPNPAKVIVLSLHHQPGLKVSPNIVLVERDPCPYDPIPMIRLRMSGPISRIVISWESR